MAMPWRWMPKNAQRCAMKRWEEVSEASCPATETVETETVSQEEPCGDRGGVVGFLVGPGCVGRICQVQILQVESEVQLGARNSSTGG